MLIQLPITGDWIDPYDVVCITKSERFSCVVVTVSNGQVALGSLQPEKLYPAHNITCNSTEETAAVRDEIAEKVNAALNIATSRFD